ncbi:MAG: universal stress protein [Thermosynechococcaceae cyanobacterium]
MYQTILVAVDLSDFSEMVFQQALQLAKLCRAKLIVLHVLSSDEQGFPIIETFPYGGFEPVLAEGYLERWHQHEQQGLQHLKLKAEQAQKEGVAVDAIQIPGSPGTMICDVAHEHHVDLIMVGNRGRSGLSEWLLGSVSNYVMHHAPCSVEIIKSKSADAVNPMP